MKKIFFYTLAVCMVCCVYACSGNDDTPDPEVFQPDENLEKVDEEDAYQPGDPIELTVRQGEKAASDNRFAFQMFKEVSNLNGVNTFFSPLSLNMALGMLYNGASGDTRTEMAQVLGLADLTDIEINEYYRKMRAALLNIDPLTDIGIANSIWYREGFAVKQPFIDMNKIYFDAMVKALDFNRPEAVDVINGWCAEKTKDKIKEIIEWPISPGVVMYLINALYFKSKWLYEFDKKRTEQRDFFTTGNQRKKVNMMLQTATLRYYIDQNLECVEIPFGNESFSMVVIKPYGDSAIDRLIDYLDNDVWQQISDRFWETDVALSLPRFKVECELPLNEPVMNTGMKRIFSGGLANISDMPLMVSEIRQKTFVEVNEEGAEAAAVTVIEISTTGNTTRLFIANRPFLYLIKEKSTGTILFIGRMDDPNE